MIERQYQLSEEAAKNPNIQELSDLIGDFESDERNGYSDDPTIVSFEVGGEPLRHDDDRLALFFGSASFRSLSYRQKHETLEALAIDESRTWGLGVSIDSSSDLLFDSDAPRIRIPAHTNDALLLSGAVGHEIATIEKINELAGEIEPDKLRRNMLIGGVAVSRLLGPRWHELKYKSYDTMSPNDEIGHRMWIGADLHGDFQVIRQTLFSGAIDPLGRKQPFGPVQEVAIQAYHSVELDVVRALLEYQVVYTGIHRRQLFDAITRKLELGAPAPVDINPFDTHPYADFGASTGDYEGRRLLHSLQVDDRTIGRSLIDNAIGPGEAMKVHFQIIAENDGVRIANTSEEYPDSNSGFTLSLGEINDFLATLMRGAHGRTSESAMRNVLGVLATR